MLVVITPIKMEKLMPALASYKIIPNNKPLYIIADTSNLDKGINNSDRNIEIIDTNKTKPNKLRLIDKRKSNNQLYNPGTVDSPIAVIIAITFAIIKAVKTMRSVC